MQANFSSIPPEIMADAQSVAECVARGQPVPAELAKRVQERSKQIRVDLLKNHGIQDIGVPAIRELRGELPKS
jgi:hypothetical protein